MVGPLPLARPVQGAPSSPSNVVKRWPAEFSRLAISQLIDHYDPWKALAAELGKGTTGLRAVSEERRVRYKNQTVTNYRIRVERTAASAKSLGTTVFEIVVDGKYWLPVTMRSIVRTPKGVYSSYDWTVNWKSKANFDPKLFKI
jgi:hypothetical protein